MEGGGKKKGCRRDWGGAKFLPKGLKFIRSEFLVFCLFPTADSTHITLFLANIY
jgi:hypothetical protein